MITQYLLILGLLQRTFEERTANIFNITGFWLHFFVTIAVLCKLFLKKIYIYTCLKKCPLLPGENKAICVQGAASLQSCQTDAAEKIIHCQNTDKTVSTPLTKYFHSVPGLIWKSAGEK